MNKLLSEILRPTSFDEITIPEDIKKRLVRMSETGNVMNMMFYGKSGSGKTSMGKLFTNSEKFESLIINGSLETSIEDIRRRVLNFVTSVSMMGRQKICFIDESDYLSKSSQASLRGVIEDCSDNCRFIFTCNDLKKIHPALCSRLLSICFDMTSSQQSKSLEIYTQRTLKKLKEHLVEIDDDRVTRIISMYYPDYRTISNHLEYELM
jgi:replication-associated recombination protein RarA